MTFAQLALVCAVALLGPLLAVQRLARLPVVVGELAVGIALGATGFRVLDSTNSTFAFLAQVGFALVMLVAGSHVPLRDPALRAGALRGVARAVGIGALSVPVALVLAHLFGTGHTALYAVLLTSSSASLIMPALAGAPLSSRAMVEMVPQIALADAVSIVLLPLVIDPRHVARAAVGAVLVIAGGLVVFALLRTLERRGLRQRVHGVSEENGLAVELRSTLALLFALSAIATVMHVSIMLAGFAMGLALAGLGEPRRLSKQVFALTEGFFAPIFFVWLGSSLNLRELAQHPDAIGLGVALGLSAALVHGMMGFTGQPWPVALVTSAQLGVPVAAATLGTTLGVLHPAENTAILLGALVTVALTAALSGRVVTVARHGAPPQRVTPATG
ncbi:Kef-type K+ transport system membrane component KefB [Phycicoccus badiiscoriae]|uniref:Kef-type K+ transport system membrane component KefB n=1 Tax=Pedococcus badiiscoriae TaxID=642776 RepID=A0A852WGT0_9MICO|nr:Kef-type K+ transport system membrane component KefB [Pedococcus badiiscoriae]